MESKKDYSCWQLYSTFFKIGLFMFGGGYAMLPLLQREVVDKMKLVDEDELLSIFAMSQCTPGPIAINSATCLGRKANGLKGSISATAGVITPSIIIISVISLLFSSLPESEILNHGMAGIRVAVAALILVSAWNLGKKAVKGWKQIGIMVVSFILVALVHISPVWVIAGSAAIGLIFLKDKKEGESHE